jgi:deazaflavin-dependent oxidoreductase (nitroreductase family)
MFPRRLAHVNRRLLNPVLRPLAYLLPPFAVVEHRGRVSGRRYRTPVFAFRRSGEIVIVLSYGRSDWLRNLLNSGGGSLIRLTRRREMVAPRVVPTGEVGRLSPLGRFSCRFAEDVVIADLDKPGNRS